MLISTYYVKPADSPSTSRREAMQFLTIYRPANGVTGAMPEHMAQMQTFVEESMKAGVLLTTGSFMPKANGASMRLANGKFSVGEAPADQEKVAGFAILKAESEEELADMIKRFLELAGDGECEVLRLNEFPQQ
jgi:hypothetical protein